MYFAIMAIMHCSFAKPHNKTGQNFNAGAKSSYETKYILFDHTHIPVYK